MYGEDLNPQQVNPIATPPRAPKTLSISKITTLDKYFH